MDTFYAVLATLGGTAVVIVLVAGSVFGAFKLLGEKWLENKFTKEVEAFRHEQVKELERIK